MLGMEKAMRRKKNKIEIKDGEGEETLTRQNR